MMGWYSVIVATGIAIGVWLASREAERKGFKKHGIYDSALWVITGGLIGAWLCCNV